MRDMLKDHLEMIEDDGYQARRELKGKEYADMMRAKEKGGEHWKRHPMYKEEVERAEKLRHTPGAEHSHDPAYENSKKNK